jgi:MurNAc alpha-1-phosphate uridylyltransferase
MRPLSDTTPKPLLHAGGKRLIEWHLEALARMGVREVVINTSHLAEQFPAALGDGSRWNLRITYSYEGLEPLETGGGMLRALPLLGSGPFIAVNGDIRTNFDFSTLPQDPAELAHLVLVDNPPHHRAGDFVLSRDGRLLDDSANTRPLAQVQGEKLTFAGIGVYRPELLTGQQPGKYSLVPILRAAMRAGRVSGEHFRGTWSDVGTPQRLAELDRSPSS